MHRFLLMLGVVALLLLGRQVGAFTPELDT
jgi:hypothetical protein